MVIAVAVQFFRNSYGIFSTPFVGIEHSQVSGSKHLLHWATSQSISTQSVSHSILDPKKKSALR